MKFSTGVPPLTLDQTAKDILALLDKQQYCLSDNFSTCIHRYQDSLHSQARAHYLSGTSAIQVAREISTQHQEFLLAIFEQSGLSQYCRQLSVTPLVVGGLGRQNCAMRSDLDLVFWGNSDGIGEFEKRDAKCELPLGISLLRKIEVSGLNVSYLTRVEDDLELFLERGNIDVITTLLGSRPLLPADSGFDQFQRFLRSFVVEHREQILRQIANSVEERTAIYGSICTLAQFNLKESRGGLRDLDTVAWVEEIEKLSDKSAFGTQSAIEGELLEVREILMGAKLAWHFSQESRMAQRSSVTSMASTAGLRRPIDRINYVGYGERREEFSRILSQALGGKLGSLDIDQMLYRAAFVTANFVDQHVLPRCFDRHCMDARSFTDRQHSEPITERMFGDHLQDSEDITPFVRELQQSGELGRLLPAFRQAEAFIDRSGFHKYSLGEHHLRTLERVEHLVKNGREIYPELHNLFVSDPAPIYLAALCHDIAKPHEQGVRNHHIVGAQLTESIAQRIGFNPYQVSRACHLVEDHMAIADLAGRFFHPLTAEMLGERVVERLYEPAYLRELLLLTLADRYASNPDEWSPARELSIFTSYYQLQQFLQGATRFSQRMLSQILDPNSTTTPCADSSQIGEFVAGIDRRLLTHYSPIVLDRQVAVLEQARQQRNCGEPVFAIDLLRMDVRDPEPRLTSLPLYHLLIACQDTPGLLGRLNKAIVSKGMKLRSAYIHTIDGLACDYLTLEPLVATHRFLADDYQRFANSLATSALNTEIQIPMKEGAKTKSGVTLADHAFVTPLEVAIQPEWDKKHLFVTLSGRVHEDIIGKIAPLLEFENLSIVGAKLRTGNRQLRYVLYLDTSNYDRSRLPQLESGFREALGQ